MTIALIAHDSKKELMVQFCTAYCRILSQHKLVATGTTGKLIAEATGLQVQRFLAGVQGGDQQIASRIACNEIDLLLFFRDPINAKPSEPNEMTLLRLCDVHNIPMATNIATAEVLIHGLERGDLDWRDIVHPQNYKTIWNGSACAAPYSAETILIMRKSGTSADVPDFNFHGNGVRTAECISAAVRLFPQEAKTADAVCRSGLACEKRIPENPQIFRNSNIKIMFPLNMARVQRRPFETYG